MLYRLPELYVGRWFANRSVRKYLERHMSGVPEADKYCMVRVETYARPIANAEEMAKWVAHIPAVTRHTSWAASERAIAILSEEAAHFGWHFHMSMRRTELEGYPHERQAVHPDTLQAISGLLQAVDEDDRQSGDDALMHAIGAKGRRAMYMSWAKHPRDYALGVRVRAKPQLVAVAA